jgi:hypothetical protein
LWPADPIDIGADSAAAAPAPDSATGAEATESPPGQADTAIADTAQ